jgi:hypothetical protein
MSLRSQTLLGIDIPIDNARAIIRAQLHKSINLGLKMF